MGVQASGSAPAISQIVPAASNQFPSLGDFSSPSFGELGEQTKEQMDAQKEQGFMPHNPFGSSSNLASSNIAAPTNFKDNTGGFGGNFKFPKAFHSGIGSFGSGGFGGSPSSQRKEAAKPASPGTPDAVEHKPRGKSASVYRPRYAQSRSDTFERRPKEPKLHASETKTEEKKNKGFCKVVEKDGMICEVSLPVLTIFNYLISNWSFFYHVCIFIVEIRIFKLQNTCSITIYN